MERLKMSILVLCLLILPASASINDPNDKEVERLAFASVASCFNYKKIEQILSEGYGEIPIGRGHGYLDNLKTNSPTEGDILFYINPVTKSFSVVIYFKEDDISCVLLTGEGLRPNTVSDVEL